MRHRSGSPEQCKRQVSASGPGRLPFAALPHDLVHDGRLNAAQVRLAAVLCWYARGKAECWPSVPTLAVRLGCCRRSVQINSRALEAAGWVATKPADNATHRVFVLTWRLPPPGAADCAPPAQPVAPSPAQLAAPERETGTRKKPPKVAASAGPSPAGPEKRESLPPVRTAEAGRTHYASWLERPAGDPLRLLAEGRLRELVVRGSVPASAAGETVARGAFRGLRGSMLRRPSAPAG